MNNLYSFLGLQNQKALNLDLLPEKILSHTHGEKRKQDFSFETKNIHKMTLKYSLKASQAAEPKELQIIEIEIDQPKYCTPILRAFIEAIPYAFLLVFNSYDRYCLVYNDPEDHNNGFFQSEWIYEEELSDEFLDYVLEQGDAIDEYDLQDDGVISDLLTRFIHLFNSFLLPKYICLRRLMDCLRIRECVDDQEYLKEVVEKLINYGNIIELDYLTYAVDFGDAIHAFQEVEGSPWGHVLVDDRYSTDRFFDAAPISDWTTMDEMESLYRELKDGRYDCYD